MGGLLWLAAWLVPVPDGHVIAQALLLLVLISCAIAAYGLLLVSLGVIRWDDAVKAVRQTADSDLRDRGARGN
jgi:putative peptidoglycan lipid II flippase